LPPPPNYRAGDATDHLLHTHTIYRNDLFINHLQTQCFITYTELHYLHVSILFLLNYFFRLTYHYIFLLLQRHPDLRLSTDLFNALLFQSDLSEAFSSFSTFHDPNKTWKIWKEIFLEIAPLRQRRVKSECCRWMTNEIKKQCYHMHRLLKKESG
jgi:hypothetical protein